MLARLAMPEIPAASVPKAVAKAVMASSVGANTVKESVAANVLSNSAAKTACVSKTCALGCSPNDHHVYDDV